MGDGSDLDWLGLERAGSGSWTFDVTPELSRLDGKFYGGTGIATATAVMEAETGRRAVWASVQFVATGKTGDRVRIDLEVNASGRSSSQLQVQGWIGDRLLFAGIGATGEARESPLEFCFATMPDVPEPENCPKWKPPGFSESFIGDPGWLAISDVRQVEGANGVWLRLRDHPLSRPAVAFLADILPSGVMRAAGRRGAGTSLDNTVRFGPDPTGDWMLVEMDPHMVSGGYIHGTGRLWTRSGELIGVASQTAGILLFD